MGDQAGKSNILSSGALSIFFESIGMLVKAGIPLSNAPSAIGKDFFDATILKTALLLEKEAESGVVVFSEAMENTKMFPAYAVKTVQLAEFSGRVEEAFFGLGEYYNKEDLFHKQMKSSVLTPAILSAVMAAVLFTAILWIIPVLNDAFARLGIHLQTGNMGAVLALGRVLMASTGMMLLVVVVFSVIVITTKAEKREKIFAFLPGAKPVLRARAMAKMASALSVLLKSGLLPVAAFQNAVQFAGDEIFRDGYDACLQKLESGVPLAKGLIDSGVFTGFESQILLYAENSGQLDETLDRMADLYDKDAEAATEKTLAIIEPFLVSILALSVGFVLVVVLLPLMQLMNGI